MIDQNKTCTKCGKEKSIILFCIDKTTRDGRHPWCRPCRSEKRMGWYRTHKDMHHKTYNEWYARNAVGQNKKSKIYRDKNKDKIYKKIRIWVENNRSRVREYNVVRDERVKGDFKLQEWRDIKKKYNYTCLSCGKKEPNIILSMDHIIPVVEGGMHTKSNIQPLCISCNSIKWRKTIDYRRGMYDTAI